MKKILGSVYTCTDLNGSVPILAEIGFAFTLDLLDLYSFRSSVNGWNRSKQVQFGNEAWNFLVKGDFLAPKLLQ